MDYSKLSDFEINKRVADIAMDGKWHVRPSHPGNKTGGLLYGSNGIKTYDLPDYCNNPADAWPIIVDNEISLMYEEAIGKWCAGKPYWVDGCEWQLDIDVMEVNPLRAAMIVFLMMQESQHA
ncbi:phage protein NinX family protein [Cronobacter sakazakii]